MKPLLFLAGLCVAVAAGWGGTPTGDEILAKVEEHFAGVEDYTVNLLVTVDLERLRVPPMHITMYFKQPDRVHFSSRGFALLPRESMAFTTARFRERFTVEDVAVRRDSGRLRYDLTLKPKEDRTKLRRFVLTVDPEHWTTERLTAPQFDGRTMEALFEHRQVEGRWLPASLEVKFSAPKEGEDEQALPGAPRQPVPRNGSISLRFSDYRLNTGLPDSLFNDSNPR
jgi:outer membrane lipoprotein-sorting protein